jgi:hypothetical protein
VLWDFDWEDIEFRIHVEARESNGRALGSGGVENGNEF